MVEVVIDDDGWSGDEEEARLPGEGLRRRPTAAPIDRVPFPPSPRPIRAAPVEDWWERTDRDERRLGTYVAIALVSFALVLVLARRAAIGLARSRSIEEEEAPIRERAAAFEFVDHASWTDYERDRIACASPSDAEAAAWAISGEACAKGSCLDVGEMLRKLEERAIRDGESYSTAGRSPSGAPVPCACAFRAENGTARSYLDPREKRRSGDAFVARVEIDLFGGSSARLEVPERIVVAHRSWPSGEEIEIAASGIDVVRWAVAEFVMRGDEGG